MKCTVESTGETRIHNTLHNTAFHFKKRLDAHHSGESPFEGSTLEKMACLAFLAFSVEAHANFVGSEREIKDFTDRSTWKAKLKKIFADSEVDWNKDPLDTICKLFELRDFFAHGRPVSHQMEKEVEVEVANPEEERKLAIQVAPWEALLEEIDYDKAYNAVDQVWKMMLDLHEIDLFETLDGKGFNLSYSEV